MRHALTMNSCPFCGKNIFSNEEFDFRRSIYKILIKNGVEDDAMMSGIVDDISRVLREEFIEGSEEQDPEAINAENESRTEEIVVSSRRSVPDEENLEDLPVRDLTPDPRRTQAQPTKLTQADKVALAAREWEASQRIDDDDAPGRRIDAGGGADDDGEDIPFFDGTTAVKVDPAIEAKKLAAIEAKKRLIAAQGSGFKTKPIQRK
jgi:hypothetical protein